MVRIAAYAQEASVNILIILLLTVIFAIGCGVYKIVLKPILFESMPEFTTDDRLYDLFGIRSPGYQESQAAERRLQCEHATRILRDADTKIGKDCFGDLYIEDPKMRKPLRADFARRRVKIREAVRTKYGNDVLRSALLKLELA